MSKKTSQLEGDSGAMYRSDIQMSSLYIEMKSVDTAQVLYKKLVEDKYFDKNPFVKAKIYNNYGNLLCDIK